jgi:hypothetical protein
MFGTELIALVEEVLPARFGGDATDYQFVEEEVAGSPVVSLLVHPRLAGIDERAVLETVLDELRACPGGGPMSDTWRAGGLLRVQRRDGRRAALGQPLHDAAHGQCRLPAATAADARERRHLVGRADAVRHRHDGVRRLSARRTRLQGGHRGADATGAVDGGDRDSRAGRLPTWQAAPSGSRKRTAGSSPGQPYSRHLSTITRFMDGEYLQ